MTSIFLLFFNFVQWIRHIVYFLQNLGSFSEWSTLEILLSWKLIDCAFVLSGGCYTGGYDYIRDIVIV